MSLPKMIADKLKELNLAPTAAAEKFGVAYPSFSAVLDGRSLPNARTFKKYGKLLGIGADKVEEMVVAAKGSKPAGKRRGRPPGSKGRRGRPPGRRSSGGGVARSLQDAVKVVAAAEALLADELASRVHELSTAQRRVVESVVASFR